MAYEVLLGREAEKYIEKLPKTAKARVFKALSRLGRNPSLGKILSGKLKGLYSLRIGDLRAIYSIAGDMVVVHAIAPRGQAYK